MADMSLDGGRGIRPRLRDPYHQVAVAGVVGLIRPADAVRREQAHVLWGNGHQALLCCRTGGSATRSLSHRRPESLPVMRHSSMSAPAGLSRIDHFSDSAELNFKRIHDRKDLLLGNPAAIL